ncbi:hypothetical protein [Achromobacter sp. 2789STDY5608621]|uniref:hypothetical protein n=1 Tax=Achromobacter sp. 2789STDY5608621 TaxID=1806496 RepID=UPI0006C670B9|nr:hypothetical protein [Achromobacter sp. 2789STDY5608621]CUI86355.1 Uncharacterised protein [Achromobacter sp. 2789STDY5608621]
MTTTIPAGWKLVAKKTCYMLMHDGAVIATLAGPDSKENAAIIASLLAAPAPPVSTVEQDPPAAWMEPGIDIPVTNEYRNKTPLRQAKYSVPLYRHAPVAAPAAGDALDAARYRWLREMKTDFGHSAQHHDLGKETIWLRFSGYGRNVDAAIDAAIAAQRQGDA